MFTLALTFVYVHTALVAACLSTHFFPASCDSSYAEDHHRRATVKSTSSDFFQDTASLKSGYLLPCWERIQLQILPSSPVFYPASSTFADSLATSSSSTHIIHFQPQSDPISFSAPSNPRHHIPPLPLIHLPRPISDNPTSLRSSQSCQFRHQIILTLQGKTAFEGVPPVKHRSP